MDSIVDDYLVAYDEEKALESELKAAKQRRQAVKEALIRRYEELGTDVASDGERSVKFSVRSKQQVTDFNALQAHVESLNEPISTYMEMGFKKEALSDLVTKAQAQALLSGGSVSNFLPPGLGIFTMEVLTVRKSPKRTMDVTQAKDILDNTLGGE